ncbi:zinc ABC transporter substrate-binding protein [Ornithinimicrobium pratense]|uniref:Zinc ABC transporter substrate-binding protein n=2 Tax=Ornithinimicrobium pratense TaxID=2593973 RepID=A0A5J6VA55_9MICO|nr:zinc ABC transporter substrate-binding protein [Ornithinimicrobium pratense]
MLTACGGAGPPDEASTKDSGGSDEDSLAVVAAFYPLAYAVERVAGDRVELTTLTAPGADPHTLELSPGDVRTVAEADLVVYSGGMQAPVDSVVHATRDVHALDVAPLLDLKRTGAGVDEEVSDAEGTPHPVDPHWWLDLDRYAVAAGVIADELSLLDPAGADAYRRGAEALAGDLGELAAEYEDGLAQCRQQIVVTSHEAFGYLTDAHGLVQVGISGLAPEAEPSPARMADIAAVVREHDVDTVYAEVILGSQLAETIASETGARVLVLDPVEGITSASPGSNYLEVMRSNLEALRDGQGCS